MIKKLLYSLIFIVSIGLFFCSNSTNVNAKEIVASKTTSDIFGNAVGTIQIYDNGEIVVGYKYGLRKVDLYYCQKGEECDNNYYSVINILTSDANNRYKNENEELAIFSYTPNLDENIEYKLIVEAYFGTNSGYSGVESINGSFTISGVQSVDTEDTYIKTSLSKDVKNENIKGLLAKLKEIVNSIVMPILFAVITMVLIVKGGLLGLDIVKSADDPQVRKEKIGALKWLVIGVAIAYLGSFVVGVITGFFSRLFN